jgi:hypothetical protein
VDLDHQMNASTRLVQLTPPGSGVRSCSATGSRLQQAPPTADLAKAIDFTNSRHTSNPVSNGNADRNRRAEVRSSTPRTGWTHVTRPPIARPRRRPALLRLALMVALGGSLLGACGNTPSPSQTASPGATSSPQPSSAAPSESPVEAACAATDIVASGGPWGGAAGSRGSDVTVQNGGATPCLLPAAPTIAFVDATGRAVLTNAPGRAGSGPSLAPGGTIGFSLVFGNWCDQQVSLPLHVSLALASGTIDIANLQVATTDELPPCNGPGQPASISATDWETP